MNYFYLVHIQLGLCNIFTFYFTVYELLMQTFVKITANHNNAILYKISKLSIFDKTRATPNQYAAKNVTNDSFFIFDTWSTNMVEELISFSIAFSHGPYWYR